MIRVAFPLIGGRQWTGGYNYLLNLVRVLGAFGSARVAPILYFGNDVAEQDLAPFAAIPTATVVRDGVFDEANKSARLREAIVTGRDSGALRLFRRDGVEVAFEPAQFYGWRSEIRALAWVPDFQHRHLPQLFTRSARLRRDVGLRLGLASGRRIMLSSLDARDDCERFYPASRGRTEVVRFAIPRDAPIEEGEALATARKYDLPERFFFLPNQFWIHKNHETVIRALAHLRRHGADVPVVAMSGRGEDPRRSGHFATLREMIGEAGLDDRARLLGLIDYADVARLMRASTALINPSMFEGWSTTVEEAKATGTPMLLSDIPVHREQSSAASFFDPYDPISLAHALLDFPSDSRKRNCFAKEASIRSLDAAAAFADAFARAAEHVLASSER
jgi:glycosyltransferase involved in cell wall biosynthesis